MYGLFPTRRRGNQWTLGYLTGSPPPFSASTFSCHYPPPPPPPHPRMTQNLPRRHHLAISQNHGTQWITVCAPSDTHVRAAVRGPKMTAPALGDRLNFSVHVCVHPQGSLCTCKCSYIAINMYGNICGDFVNKTWEQLMQVLYLDITRLWSRGLRAWPSFQMSLNCSTYAKVKT